MSEPSAQGTVAVNVDENAYQSLLSFGKKTQKMGYHLVSPVPDLEMLLEVNLNFQVRLTIMLAQGWSLTGSPWPLNVGLGP